jgi:hypothetical protein
MTIATYSVTTTIGNAYISGGNTAITSLTLCNFGANEATANLYVVPNSSTPDTVNIALSNVVIASGDTLQMYIAAEKLLLGPGDSIRINANANVLTAITSYTSI